MLVNKLGEFGLIERIKKTIKTDESVVKGIGDDCAVIKLDKYNYGLFTCDMLVESVDFKPQDEPYLIGRKAVAVSMSDIAACGGLPRYCLVSLGIPKDTSVDKIDKIFYGIRSLSRIFKTNIVGGDISSSPVLTIDVSMWGIVEKKRLVLRNGAARGDMIFVTGRLGDSISGRHLKFIPRIKEARFLVENFKVNAMIDISDGFAQDLGHILKESNVGAIIYEDLLPKYRKSTSLESMLYGGEDYELLFTLPIGEAKKLLSSKLSIFTPVGHITHNRFDLRLIDRKCRVKKIPFRGFRHF